MPNWVYTKVHFTGEEKEIERLKSFVKSDENDFDFDNIIPMPPELNLESGSSQGFAKECSFYRRVHGMKTTDNYENGPEWRKSKSFDEWADLGDQYLSNKEKYGHETWYDWCCDKWGTKWNSCDASWEGNDVYFNTAWNVCEPVFKRLAELFPKVDFEVEFADEDLGRNCGTISHENGEFIVNYIDTLEFACDVWGYDYEEIIAESEEG